MVRGSRPRCVTMTTILHFPLPAKCLTMNQRLHWAAKAKLTAAWRGATAQAAIEAVMDGAPLLDLPRSVVKLVVPVKSLKVRRDAHNWYPTVKACVDGCVDAGLFQDDTGEYVVTVEPGFHTAPDVELHITPWDEA